MFNYRSYPLWFLIFGIFIVSFIDSMLLLAISTRSWGMVPDITKLNELLGFSSSIYLTVVFKMPLFLFICFLGDKKSSAGNVAGDIQALLFGFFLTSAVTFFLFPVIYLSSISATFTSIIFQKILFISILLSLIHI